MIFRSFTRTWARFFIYFTRNFAETFRSFTSCMYRRDKDFLFKFLSLLGSKPETDYPCRNSLNSRLVLVTSRVRMRIKGIEFVSLSRLKCFRCSLFFLLLVGSGVLTWRNERIWGIQSAGGWGTRDLNKARTRKAESKQAVKGSRIGLHLKSLARPCLVLVISF